VILCVYVEIYSCISMFCMHELDLSVCLSTDRAVYTYGCICMYVHLNLCVCVDMYIHVHTYTCLSEGTTCWRTEVALCEYSEYPHAMPVRP
jgi:hypothetical protein